MLACDGRNEDKIANAKEADKLKSLIDLFVVLISPPHSTIGFTDRTPIHLLPQQYLPLKWGF